LKIRKKTSGLIGTKVYLTNMKRPPTKFHR